MGAALVARELMEQDQRINAIRRLKQIKRHLRDASNPFLLEPEYFRKHYRVTPHVALLLVEILHDDVVGARNTAIPAHLQILSVLRFLSEGNFQKGTASDFNHPISQATMSRCIERVVNAIIRCGSKFIRFPTTPEERRLVSNRFLAYNRIHNILGLIDCFKVSFWRPPQQEEAFFNYQAGTSMNVQVIADADYLIRSIRICPGSNTDAFIWQYSNSKEEMLRLRNNPQIMENEGPYYLLGDNGYSPSPILLTPIVNAVEGSPEALYTEELVSTRCKVEQCFGILTRVWLVISRARKLFYAPRKVAKIVTACAILHNFRKLNGIIDDIEEVPARHENVAFNGVAVDYQAGLQERREIINRYYRQQ